MLRTSLWDFIVQIYVSFLLIFTKTYNKSDLKIFIVFCV